MVQFYKSLEIPVSLNDIKKHSLLQNLQLLKQSRLSVMSIDSKSWKVICNMGKMNDKLSNEWFKVLLGMDVIWSEKSFNFYEGTDRKTGKVLRTASRCDLVFGSNSELRSLSELYSQEDNNEKFVKDFIKTWVKVMNSDRFDLLA